MARKHSPSTEGLIDQLAEVFSGRALAGVRVINEPVSGSRYRHMTVVWEKWDGVSQPERSKAILDAFERAHPKEPWRVLEITLALGLTPIEAQKLNIKAA